MANTIARFNYHDARRERLLKRLEQIRSIMLSNEVLVASLLFEGGKTYAQEAVEAAAQRLCDLLDQQQKVFFAFGDCDEVAAERVSRAGEDWKAAVRDLGDRESVVTCDLDALPTTLADDERRVTYAFFYCCLHACLCPAFGRRRIEDLRNVMQATARLANAGAWLPGVYATRADSSALTHDDLLFWELYESASQGSRAFLHPDRHDAFSLLDAMYVAVVQGRPADLDDPEKVREIEESSYCRHMREDLALGRDLEEELAQQECLRGVADMSAREWLACTDVERYEGVLRHLQESDEQVVLGLIDDFGFQVMLTSATSVGSDAVQWRAMSHERRVSIVREVVTFFLDEARYEQEHGGAQRMEDWWQAQANELCDSIRGWVDATGCADELFAQYGVLRRLFFEGFLPAGAYEGFGSMWGTLNVEGFERLAEGALERFLGEAGVSRTMNDALFMHAFNQLDEVKYRLDTMLLAQEIRR